MQCLKQPKDFRMTINDNLSVIRERITQAARRAGRNPEDVVLVAASKGVDAERLKEAISAGLRIFGESRVQEAMTKLQALRNEAEWHFIGHLQGNKVKYVVGKFTLIHSVDSVELAEEINGRAEKTGVIQDILMEVNVSGEKGKFGIMPEELITVTKAISGFRHISLKGLMTIPPYSDNPEEARPHFSMLRKLRDNARQTGLFTDACMDLSMGMSGDFEVAIEEGSTMVRIGTALFGTRIT